MIKSITLVFTFCFLGLCQSAFAQSEADFARVAASPAWLRLLHYLPSGDGYKSEVDGKGFFFAADGKTNPLSEIKATASAFSQNLAVGILKLHPQCAFPERLRFLTAELGLKITPVPCPKLDEFMAMFDQPKSVSLVFSSAYPNNPASMFGHTFLKIKNRRKNDLLSKGVNFAAWSDPNSNILIFMAKGLAGGFRGVWTIDPYFVKVNEYVNSESRDLWEYELNLTEAETARLLHHIWELETSSYFDYYFFDENCAYQILRAIEAVRPEMQITAPRWYQIPGETLKDLVRVPDLVSKVNFRPSLFHQLERLNRTFGPFSAHQLDSPPESASIGWLETAMSYQLYKKSKLKSKWSDENQRSESRILNLRRKLVDQPTSEISQNLPEPKEWQLSRPELGHDAYALFLSSGAYDSQANPGEAFIRGRFRTAYHDLLARDDGYLPFSEIEFPSLKVEGTKKNIRVQEIGLLNITSLVPANSFHWPRSWRVKAGWQTERGLECFDCLIPGVEVGAGLSLGGVGQRFYALGLLSNEAHRQLDRGFRTSVGAEFGSILQVTDQYKLKMLGRSLWRLPRSAGWRHQMDWGVDQSLWLNRNNETRLLTRLISTPGLHAIAYSEFEIQWVHYFR